MLIAHYLRNAIGLDEWQARHSSTIVLVRTSVVITFTPCLRTLPHWLHSLKDVTIVIVSFTLDRCQGTHNHMPVVVHAVGFGCTYPHLAIGASWVRVNAVGCVVALSHTGIHG